MSEYLISCRCLNFDIDIGTDIIAEDGGCPYNNGHAAQLYWKLASCCSFLLSLVSLCVHEEGVTIQPHHLRWCGKHVCCTAALKINAVLVPQNVKGPNLSGHYPVVLTLCQGFQKSVHLHRGLGMLSSAPLLVFFRHPLSLATKVTSCTLMWNYSAQGHHLSQKTSVPVSTECCLPHSQELPWTMLVVVSSWSGRWARLWRVELCPWSHIYKDVGIIWTTCWRAMNLPATMIHVLEA